MPPWREHREQGRFEFGVPNASLPDPDEFEVTFLGLAQMRGMGDAGLRAMVRYSPTLLDVWTTSPNALRSVLAAARIPRANQLAEQVAHGRDELIRAGISERERMNRLGVQLIPNWSADYPAAFREIDSPPAWIFAQGNLGALTLPNLAAVVGTRQATEEGRRRTKWAVEQLARFGFGIVSGLAEGIDAAAHEFALDLGAPCVAVLGTGVLVAFPAATSHLRRRIVEQGGVLISEFLPQDSYSAGRFVQRNRLQAALASVVIPVEGAVKGGTSHTVRFAKRYGRRLVALGRGTGPDPEINELLRELQATMIDIEAPDSAETLRLAVGADRNSETQMPAGWQFQSVMPEIHRIAREYGVTVEDVNAFLNQLLEIARENGRSSRNS
jgi:DNA protecting protein DprA